jgi:hypothetical protein
MAELRAPEQNRLLGQLARMLRTTEGDIAAPEFLPKSLDVMGLVRQLMLPSAETVEKLSYGDPLFRMPTQSNIPITADREYLAEVLGMAPAVPAASRATTRLSNEAADQLVRAITRNPEATAPQVLEAAGQMLPLSRIVRENPEPFMVAHGTTEPFAEFKSGMGRTARDIYTVPESLSEDASLYGSVLIKATASPKKMIDFSDYDKLDQQTISAIKKAAEDSGVTDEYYTFDSFLDDLMTGQLYQSGGGPRAQNNFLAELFSEYDAVKMPDARVGGGLSQSVVVQNPNLLKVKEVDGEPVEKAFPGLLDQPAQSVVENPFFRTWFAGSDAAKESGEPITLYHATTHDFDTFSLNRANPENHYGKGFYLTDSIDDANLNYAGIGPDLEIKIELRTERLADELMDMTPEDVADMARELNVDESLIDLAKIEESGASPELIREMATKELTTHGGAVMPVYARLRNPVKVGTKDETTFRIDTEFDDDGDLVSESGNGIDLYNSLNDVGREYGIPEQQIGEVWAKISNEMIDDDITAGRVDEIIRNNVYDIYTPDGEYAGPGQFIADVFRDMGFDGIKMDAGKYFGPRQGAMGTKLKGMEGVEEATHYILFEPTQIKSALGNEGTYSLTDPSILRGVGVGGAGLLGAGMMQEEEQF